MRLHAKIVQQLHFIGCLVDENHVTFDMEVKKKACINLIEVLNIG